MIPALTARTRLVALLGDPVAHSLSPILQNAAFQAAGVDGVYLALRCDAAALRPLLRGIAAAGGAGNITVPHKQPAAAALDRRAPDAERTGACNTFWAEDGEVWGDNTDVVGVGRALEELLGGSAAGARVLLLGAGGAARAALCALADAGVDTVSLLNRTPAPAQALVARFAHARYRLAVARGIEEFRGERFDVAINATSLGLRPADPLPLDPAAPVRLGAALDLVYAPGRTAWVLACRAAGMPADDGKVALLHQGARAFERWWRVPAPLAEMRAALPDRTDDDDDAPPASAA